MRKPSITSKHCQRKDWALGLFPPHWRKGAGKLPLHGRHFPWIPCVLLHSTSVHTQLHFSLTISVQIFVCIQLCFLLKMSEYLGWVSLGQHLGWTCYVHRLPWPTAGNLVKLGRVNELKSRMKEKKNSERSVPVDIWSIWNWCQFTTLQQNALRKKSWGFLEPMILLPGNQGGPLSPDGFAKCVFWFSHLQRKGNLSSFWEQV